MSIKQLTVIAATQKVKKSSGIKAPAKAQPYLQDLDDWVSGEGGNKVRNNALKALIDMGFDATFDNYLAQWILHPLGTRYAPKGNTVKIKKVYD